MSVLAGGLGGIVANPVELAERVLEKVQDQLAKSGAFDPMVDTPEELIATALGSWIASKFVYRPPGFSNGLEDGPSSTDRPGDRDQLLAAALGACQCWGNDADCGTCKGAGATGWRIPDQELFMQYVGPAIAAATGEGLGWPTDPNVKIQQSEEANIDDNSHIHG